MVRAAAAGVVPLIILLREALAAGRAPPAFASAAAGPTCAAHAEEPPGEVQVDEVVLLQLGAASHLHRNATAPSATVDVEAPLKQKLHSFAKVVMAEANNAGNNALVGQAKVILEQSDAGMLSVDDVEALMEEMPPGQSAQTAAENGMLLTVDDVVTMSGGKAGEEAIGPGAGVEPYQGDMIPSDNLQLALFQQNERAALGSRWVAAGKVWTAGSVKYCFASDIKPHSKHIFEAAVAQYEKAIPCITFVDVGWKTGNSNSGKDEQACKESPAIFVTSASTGCHSYVGQLPLWTSQQLNLQDPGCISIGTALHQLGHALGMGHEQARPDRDAWVKIKWNNVKEGKAKNFDVAPNGFTDIPYDYLSVMHSGVHSFSVDKDKPTIVSNAPLPLSQEMGQRAGLSSSDVTQIAAMYVPEIGTCEGVAVVSEGCINKLSLAGLDVCSTATVCTGASVENCCACHGGFKVLCYEGQPCPKPVSMLPPPEATDCIVAATFLSNNWGMAYGCVYENICDFDVSWTCPSLPCTHSTTPGGYKATSCNGVKQTEICNPGVCEVFKS